MSDAVMVQVTTAGCKGVTINYYDHGHELKEGWISSRRNLAKY